MMQGYDKGENDMATQLDTLWKELEEQYPRLRQLPQLDPASDKWDDLFELCRAVVQHAGISAEDTDKIVRMVRQRVYGSRR